MALYNVYVHVYVRRYVSHTVNPGMQYNVRNIAFISGRRTVNLCRARESGWDYGDNKDRTDRLWPTYICTSPVATAKTNTAGGPTYSFTSEL